MKKWTWVFLLCISIMPCDLLADQSQAPKDASSAPYPFNIVDMPKAALGSTARVPDPRRLLDTSAPIDERRQIFSAYENLADQGNVKAQYIVGSLYRIGQKLPASPVQRDDAKAELYFKQCRYSR